LIAKGKVGDAHPTVVLKVHPQHYLILFPDSADRLAQEWFCSGDLEEIREAVRLH